MPRSNREGSLADIPPARVRFAVEAGFLILVTAGAALAELAPLAIIILAACALLLVALIEWASSRVTGRADEVQRVEQRPARAHGRRLEAEPEPVQEAQIGRASCRERVCSTV